MTDVFAILFAPIGFFFWGFFAARHNNIPALLGLAVASVAWVVWRIA